MIFPCSIVTLNTLAITNANINKVVSGGRYGVKYPMLIHGSSYGVDYPMLIPGSSYGVKYPMLITGSSYGTSIIFGYLPGNMIRRRI